MSGKGKMIIGILFVVLVVFSCKKEVTPSPTEETKSSATFNIYPVYSSQTVAIDQPITMSNGYKIEFAEIKCLFTHLKCGSTTIANDAYFNFREKGSTFLTLPDFIQNGTNFSALIGVDSSKNHLDPSSWPTSSALNIANSGDMHWSWNPGYIFIKIEGRADTIPDNLEVYDHVFSYHIGIDGNTRQLNIDNLNWTTVDGNLTANLQLDLKKVLENELNPINLKKENSTHSGLEHKALTKKIADNFVAAFSAK